VANKPKEAAGAAPAPAEIVEEPGRERGVSAARSHVKAVTVSEDKTMSQTTLLSQTAYEKVGEEMQKFVEKMMKTASELVSFNQGNLEAFVKSGQIWAAGIQDLTKQVAANSQAQWDEALNAMKALAGVKSLREALDVQANLARSALEKALQEAGRLTDVSFKLAEQTVAPLTARASLAAEKFGRV
jgi:phasin family protein